MEEALQRARRAHHDHGLCAAHEHRAHARHVCKHAQARVRAHAAECLGPVARGSLEPRVRHLHPV